MAVEDFDIYLDEWGVDATLNGQPVRVLFDNAYEEGFGVSTRQPMASMPTAVAQAVGAEQDSVLMIGAATYHVRADKPDGTGWTVLTLELQP